jgi:hypothetical protein
MSMIDTYRQERNEDILLTVMKTTLLGICVLLVCSSSMGSQTWREDRARLCFVRDEDNGSMNTLQSWIRIADYDVPVIGGQAVCLYLPPGNNELIVTSTIPYNPRSRDAEACKSKPMKLELPPSEDRTFTIEPATKGDSYACGWRVNQKYSSHKTRDESHHH